MRRYPEPAARPRAAVALDAIDRVLLDLLARDARMTNNALAAAAGIAPSTCLGRTRALIERGVIRGFHAEIDPAVLGRGLQAMIAVRLHANSRNRLAEFGRHLAAMPEVLDVYIVAGGDDYLIRVAVTDTDALRVFVVTGLSSHSAVASTETILVLDHVRPLAS